MHHYSLCLPLSHGFLRHKQPSHYTCCFATSVTTTSCCSLLWRGTGASRGAFLQGRAETHRAPERDAFKTVHIIIGPAIMLFVLVLGFYPLFFDLQTSMLLNEDFSQSFTYAYTRMCAYVGVQYTKTMNQAKEALVADKISKLRN